MENIWTKTSQKKIYDVTSGEHNTTYRWCIIELYPWNLCNLINQCYTNTFNFKKWKEKEKRYMKGQQQPENVLNMISLWGFKKWTTVRYTFARMAKARKTGNIKCWWRCRATGVLIPCWWDCAIVHLLRRMFWQFLIKLNIHNPLSHTRQGKHRCVVASYKPPTGGWGGVQGGGDKEEEKIGTTVIA